ncbi:MAG: DMT family transporter [Gaiellales bacterium]
MTGLTPAGDPTGPRLDPRRIGAALTGRVSGELMLVATVLLWGLGFSTSRYAVTHGFAPLQYSAPRFVLGGLIMVGIVVIRDRRFTFERSDLRYFVPAALIGIVLNQITFNYSVSFATAATVSLVFGTLPIFGGVVAAAVGFERLGLRHWFAAVVSFGGVALVALGSAGELSGQVVGIVLALGAALTFAVFSVSLMPLMRRHSTYHVSAVVTVAGTIPLVIVALPQLVSSDWGDIGPLAWGAFAYQTIMFVTTTYLWLLAVKRVGAAHATLWANLQPFVGAVIAVSILSESLDVVQILGAIALGSAIGLARWRRPLARIAG